LQRHTHDRAAADTADTPKDFISKFLKCCETFAPREGLRMPIIEEKENA
jgi:hypothetical protein